MRRKIPRRPGLTATMLASALALLSPRAAQAALTVTNTVNLDFGMTGIKTAGSPRNMVLTAAGAMTYPTDYAGDDDDPPNVGTFTVASTTSVAYDFACENSSTFAQITNAASNLTMSAFTITVSGAASGNGSATCNGTASAVVNNVVVDATHTATVKIGGTVAAANALTTGTYAKTGYDFCVHLHSNAACATGGSSSMSVGGTFRPAPILVSASPLDWSTVTVSGTPTAACHVDLGTNDTVAFSGCFAQGAMSTPTSGAVTMKGITNGANLNLFCDATAKLANAAGTSTITVNGLEIHSDLNRAPYAGGNCAGQSTQAGTIYTYDSGNHYILYMGGKLDGGTVTGTLVGAYSSSNPGGVSPQVTLTIQ